MLGYFLQMHMDCIVHRDHLVFLSIEYVVIVTVVTGWVSGGFLHAGLAPPM